MVEEVEGVEVLVSPVKLLIIFWLFYKNRGCSVRNKMGRKWFRIFLIRWRWLLKYLNMLLFVAIWFGNDCFRYFATNWDLLSGLVVDEIFWFDISPQNLDLFLFLEFFLL